MPLDIPICMTESQLAKARGAAHLDDSGPLDHRLNIAGDGRYGTPGLPSSQAPEPEPRESLKPKVICCSQRDLSTLTPRLSERRPGYILWQRKRLFQPLAPGSSAKSLKLPEQAKMRLCAKPGSPSRMVT